MVMTLNVPCKDALRSVFLDITKATTVKVWVWVLRHTTPLTQIYFFFIVSAVGGCLVRAPKLPPPLIAAGCVITTSGVLSFLVMGGGWMLSCKPLYFAFLKAF